MRRLSLAWVAFLLLLGFNVWHASKNGFMGKGGVRGALHLSEDFRARFLAQDPALVVSKPYDGQLFYAMTYDPLLRRPADSEWLPGRTYRYQRMLYPLLAHVAASGRPRAYPYSLFALNLLSFAAAAWLAVLLWPDRRRQIAAALAVLTTTGLIYAAFGTLSEPMAFALSMAGLLLVHRDRPLWAVPFFAAAVLTRETYATIPAGVFLWQAATRRQTFERAMLCAAGCLAPFALWYAYVQAVAPGATSYLPPEAPPSWGVGRLSLPFIAMWQETLWGLSHATTRTVRKLTLSIAVVTTLCSVVSAFALTRRRRFWVWMAFVQAAFVSMMRGDIWNYFASSCRLVIPLFVFCAFALLEPDSVSGRRVDVERP